jgi:hypothetical protein
METLVTVAVIVSMIAGGVLVIRLSHGRNGERIAAFPYARPLPGRRRRAAGTTRKSSGLADAPTHHARRDHRDGAARRLRPRRRQA